jgi:hypothetical protein
MKNNKGFPVRKAFIYINRCNCLLSELTVRTKYLLDLVDVHLLHVLTSGLQILTRIEVVRMLSEILTDGSGHGKTRVRVDVDLANSALRSLAELLLRNTYSVGQVTTELVDGVNLVLRN